ncbi:hypothetical protein TIFTF001_023874 [Ficus carica]|uniref:Uncharacterized protein n=1 Tax=Ficus carica TaxID=3494 RepID=A0AA88DE82_FICCA|nr:hypothetical protein TIFTF001_023874 [Ficus carica]
MVDMSAKYIISAVAGSFALAWVFDHYIADKKIFGGKFWTTPHTVANNEWWEETDKKFQAWPRTAGPPVVMNPISRQNFIVKTRTEEWDIKSGMLISDAAVAFVTRFSLYSSGHGLVHGFILASVGFSSSPSLRPSTSSESPSSRSSVLLAQFKNIGEKVTHLACAGSRLSFLHLQGMMNCNLIQVVVRIIWIASLTPSSKPFTLWFHSCPARHHKRFTKRSSSH